MEKRIIAGEIGNPPIEQAQKVKLVLTFEECFLMEANALVQRNHPTRKFVIDSQNRQVIEMLTNYFQGKQVEGISPHKGILLSGDIGTGKTLLMKAFSNTLKHFRKSFRFEACQDVIHNYETAGDLDVYTANINGINGKPAKICFDEIGRETIPAIHFGNRRNVMQHILNYRYSAWQNTGLLTHGTTNAQPSELIELYQAHVADRIREMFNWIPMEGNSRR